MTGICSNAAGFSNHCSWRDGFSVGNALKETNFTLMTVVLGCVSMAEIASLWMLSFGRFVKIVAGHRENNNDPVLVSRYAVNVLVFILVGIVFITVGDKYIILNPYERVPIIIVGILGSGPLMFLLAQGWYLHRIPRVKPVLYGVGGMVLLISDIVALYQPAWIYHIVLGCVLGIAAFIDFKKLIAYELTE